LAGLGRKEFNSGDILLASEVQGYLQDQAVMVFDDATARGSAIPSPSEGMLTYNKATDQLELYDGSAFGPVGSDSGLIHIETRSVSAVSAESFNDVFSTDYDNYRILISLVPSLTSTIRYRLRVGGSDNTASDYFSFGARLGGAGYQNTSLQETSGFLGNSNFRSSVVWDLMRPFVATDRSYGIVSGTNVGGGEMHTHLTNFNQDVSFTGITIFPSTGTITATISIFGYAKA